MDSVERWFEKRTWHHSEFADVAALVSSKKEQGLKISVCFPTLNVAGTVGKCVGVIRRALVDEHPLVDELCIVDSRSTDGTVEIAEAEGARVIFDDEIHPEVEPQAGGKGEALWKSLFALEGDIIVWVDSDIENIHPRFVYGLLGPLLADPAVGYVKAFYERPITEGGVTRPSGGGRVTELTVRPMFNLFYAQLAGLVQPLSGEYAGRREILESVPFFTGYGVESGLLIDICDKYGMDAIGQVDLEVRVHHNQSVESLSRMSFGIMQALFARLERDGKLSLAAPIPIEYSAFRREADAYHMDRREVRVVERPPAKDLGP